MWATVSSIEWLRKKPSVNPNVMPGRPSLRNGVKSLSIQRRRATSSVRELASGHGARAAKVAHEGLVAGARLVHDGGP